MRGKTAEALRKLRRKYGLGEFAKRRGRGKRVSKAKAASSARRATRRAVYMNSTPSRKVAGGSNAYYDINLTAPSSSTTVFQNPTPPPPLRPLDPPRLP